MKRIDREKLRWSAGLTVFCLSCALTEPVWAEVSGPGAAAVQEQPVSNEAHWELRDQQWYYHDSSGNPVQGWLLFDQVYYYLDENGGCLTDEITPDGYYVNQNGIWYVRSADILGIGFDSPDRFPSLTDEWFGKEKLIMLRATIDQVFEERRIRISDDAAEYLSGDRVLLGIYKNHNTGAYRLDVGTALDKKSLDENHAGKYDYAVFRAFLYQLSSSPELLEEAIYSSWQEDNSWKISRTECVRVGDAEVKYSAGNGYGYYHIYPANAMKQED